MYRSLLTAALAIVFALPVKTHAAILILAADPAGLTCDVADPGPGGTETVYVVLRFNSSGVTGASFAAPVPQNCGLVHMNDEPTLPFLMFGDSQTGAEVAFTNCLQGDVVVMKMHFVRTSTGDACCRMSVAAHPDYDTPVIYDCNFIVRPAAGGDEVMLNSDGSCDHILPPSNPSPLDHASDVPTLVELSWNEANSLCQASNAPFPYLYFGTTPNPPMVGLGPVENPYTVGPLLPATTYYWGVVSLGRSSPLWSFRTTAATAVKTTTWGHIKALYR